MFFFFVEEKKCEVDFFFSILKQKLRSSIFIFFHSVKIVRSPIFFFNTEKMCEGRFILFCSGGKILRSSYFSFFKTEKKSAKSDFFFRRKNWCEVRVFFLSRREKILRNPIYFFSIETQSTKSDFFGRYPIFKMSDDVACVNHVLFCYVTWHLFGCLGQSRAKAVFKMPVTIFLFLTGSTTISLLSCIKISCRFHLKMAVTYGEKERPLKIRNKKKEYHTFCFNLDDIIFV